MENTKTEVETPISYDLLEECKNFSNKLEQIFIDNQMRLYKSVDDEEQKILFELTK